MSFQSRARGAACVGVLSLLTLMAGLSGHAFAADKAPKFEQEFSAEAGEVVTRALKFLEVDDYKAALDTLEHLLYSPDLNPYELSTIYQMIGSAHFERNDYAEAIKALERAIESGGLLPIEAKTMALNNIYLYAANSDHAEVIKRSEAHLRAYPEAFDKVAPILLGALIDSKHYERAAGLAETILAKSHVKKRRDFEALIFLYSAMGQQAQADFTRQEMETALAQQAKRASRAAQ